MANTCKYYKQQKQVSYDNGQTWNNLGEFQKGELIERDSTDCNIPTPTGDVKVFITYHEYSLLPPKIVYCDGSGDLVPDDVRLCKCPNKYGDECGSEDYSMSDVIIGSCVSAITIGIIPESCNYGGTFEGIIHLSSVTIPNSVEIIGYKSFCNCLYLTNVNSNTYGECIIPNGVKHINDGAFANCRRLQRVVIPSSVINIGTYDISSEGIGVFEGCQLLTSVTIGENVEVIGNRTFYERHNLTNVNSNTYGECIIPNNVTTIGKRAFQGCRSLTSITIPSSVTSIASYAFQSCSSLASITIHATTPPILGQYYAFDNTNNCPIYVPAASVNAYSAAAGWNTYSLRIQAIPS